MGKNSSNLQVLIMPIVPVATKMFIKINLEMIAGNVTDEFSFHETKTLSIL